jgi:hypothetical protein
MDLLTVLHQRRAVTAVLAHVREEMRMNLECETGLLPDRLGYRVTATDGYRTIDFIIDEEIAARQLDFNTDGSVLLERHLRDRFPDIWRACRAAYAEISSDQLREYLRLRLTTQDFQH